VAAVFSKGGRVSWVNDVRLSISQRLREAVLSHYLVPYSRFGLDAGLVPHLAKGTPITLVDVGANRGDFAAAIRAHSGLRSAVLVEPQADLARGLQERFPERSVHVEAAAVSDRNGTAQFDVLQADSCSSLLPIRAEAGFNDRHIDVRVKARQEVRVTTLDQVLDAHGLGPTIDVLKLDTQGNELQVMNGATRAMQRVRLLWIEVSFRSLYEGDVQFAEVHDYLSARGFRFFSLHDVFRGANRELLQADALFLGPHAS